MGQDWIKIVDLSSKVEQGAQQIFFVRGHLIKKQRVLISLICILPFFKFFYTPLNADAVRVQKIIGILNVILDTNIDYTKKLFYRAVSDKNH